MKKFAIVEVSLVSVGKLDTQWSFALERSCQTRVGIPLAAYRKDGHNIIFHHNVDSHNDKYLFMLIQDRGHKQAQF